MRSFAIIALPAGLASALPELVPEPEVPERATFVSASDLIMSHAWATNFFINRTKRLQRQYVLPIPSSSSICHRRIWDLTRYHRLCDFLLQERWLQWVPLLWWFIYKSINRLAAIRGGILCQICWRRLTERSAIPMLGATRGASVTVGITERLWVGRGMRIGIGRLVWSGLSNDVCDLSKLG